MPRSRSHGCVVCGGPGPALCFPCLDALPGPPRVRVPGVGPVRCLFAYEGPGRDVVQALKYRDGRRLVTPLADALARAGPPGPDVTVTWVPTSARRRRERGFDQAELLARAVARRWSVPVRALLRHPPGPAQTGRSACERRNVQFGLARSGVPRHVVVVDDVCTTGATLAAAVAALRAGGACLVAVRVVARTP